MACLTQATASSRPGHPAGATCWSAAPSSWRKRPPRAPAAAALVLVGVSLNAYRITNNTLLQLLTPREMLGRVIGIYQTDKGLQPAGSLAFGWIAAVAGAPLAVASGALACAALTIGVILFRPTVRKL